MDNHPDKKLVNKLMEKIKNYGALSRLDFHGEAKEKEKQIEKAIYMAVDIAFANGHYRGQIHDPQATRKRVDP